ncbi:MAG: DNA polymerase III subunit gamma/tau [Firmicutes bacterium]|nr:DNA polymerase III subunit gamma/tau [Bacillota bacterium]
MYQALYRSFRPEVFDDLLGQEHIVKILQTQIETGEVCHAYLFCGTRGTGKTTTARLLAKALNCTGEGKKPCGRCPECRAIAAGEFLDVVEMDAASNNSVEDIRSLRESVNFPPVSGKKKVYIIDEAHMLSSQAANAFLKTLEEPPQDTVFILATTDPNKLPSTILSRCMRLDFRRVPEKKISESFMDVCRKIGVEADPDAVALIAANADGSVRDGLSILERCIAGSKRLTRDDVLFLLGISGIDTYLKITDRVIAKDSAGALAVLAEVLSEGKEVLQFTKDWVEHIRDLMLIKYSDDPQNMINLSKENIERLREQSDRITIKEISDMITVLSKLINDARYASKPRVLLELAIIEMCG